MLAGAVCLMAAGTFRTAQGREPQFNPPQYLDDNVPRGATSEHIYLRDCAYCHGSAGEGSGRGPTLRGVGKASVDYWLSTGRMPLPSPSAEIHGGEPAYPPAMIEALVDHVATFAPGGIDIPAVDTRGADLGRGLVLYTEQCAPCHVWSGVGGQLLHREAPGLTRSTATQVAEAVRIGPGNMPAFGEAAIPEDELMDLVAYVRTLQDPKDRGGHPLWHIGPLAEGGVAWLGGFGLLVLALAWIGERG
jgi:ubiquinol-cytochrome c reductase cytochrome c subunit